MLNLLKTLSPFNATLLEKVCNAALSLDPQKEFILQKLKGKSLRVEITDWQQYLIIYPDNDRLHFSNDETFEADCTLTGPLNQLCRMTLSEHPQSYIQSGKIEQSGDLHVLQNYQGFYKAFDMDWEYHFQKLLGPQATHLLFKPFHSIKNWTSESLKSSRKEWDDYLHEEKRLFPPREEIEDFFEDIQNLKEDVDRIEAKINQLKATEELDPAIKKACTGPDPVSQDVEEL